jgi:predicted ATP-dependent protease
MELTPEHLLRTVNAASLPFETTADIEPRLEPIAQIRARDALEFGTGIRFPGYNVYALGAPQTDKRELIISRLTELAAEESVPDDWCYLHNFEDSARPLWVQLPAGTGRRLRQEMAEFISNVRALIPAALKSDEFQRENQALASSLQQRQASDAADLEEQAKSLGLTMLPTPNGFAFAPVEDGKVMEQEAFLKLNEADRKKLQQAIDEMTSKLVERLREYPEYQQQLRDSQRKLATSTAETTIVGLLAPLRQRYQVNTKLMLYLNSAKDELLANLEKILASEQPSGQPAWLTAQDPATFFASFNVNLISDGSELNGVTDFNLIRAGALHRSNGGYLLLDAERLIQKPFAWEALKRALSDHSLRMESVSQMLNLTYSVSLEPEPIPLDVKIVLLGSRQLYHLLRHYDPDFDELFKVVADFDDDVEWDDEQVSAYAGLIARIVGEAGIRHLDAGAVARVLEHSSRLVEDRERLSTHISDIRDLLREADFIAGKSSSDLINRKHVDDAIEQRIYRLDRFRELVRENVSRGLILVETSGVRVGQINGLSVMTMGQVQFGQPTRITATARLGRGELIDIERESKLGGKIHSKAVMIVSSFLGARYARELPLSLHATLVFEQSYGGIEGDSASIAEVCALISAITEQPMKQSLAVTGSMDQHGAVQAIGGVNEKIEGFFDICREQGLTGKHGVLIPHTNRDHLMLRQDVVDSVAAGMFHVYTMASVDDAIELLFAAEDQDTIDSSTIDELMHKRVRELFELRRQIASSAEAGDDS